MGIPAISMGVSLGAPSEDWGQKPRINRPKAENQRTGTDYGRVTQPQGQVLNHILE